ncbi:DUF4386 domain-containing protein [Microbacterium lacticum]|uniref:DUF4386 domain-containing protein n=1 Tax=Microbacterium lacticum TaxID=33885 RepID=UPI0018B0454C|nr:DUF4386 domain-containing protein [Microbacterium lacticum]MBF9334817.1 DUF4386 domain-containing protein [Microbacterium lacticum]
MNDIARTSARTAGALYLVTHVTSVTAVIAYGAGALTLGVTLEFVLALGCLGTGILLWVLLGAAGPARAATFAGLRAVEAAVILAGTLPMVALTLTAPGGEATTALVAVHTAAFLVGQGLVIGVNTIVLGSLLLSSRAVPGALAVLGIGGGALVLTSDVAQLFGLIPLNGAVAGVCALPIFAFEIWLALYLIVRGTRMQGHPATSPAAVDASM